MADPKPSGDGRALSEGTSSLSLFLLGRFRVEHARVPIDEAAWRRRSAASLLKLLALAPGRRLHRDQILDALWPDAGLDAALNHFRKALHAARRALEPELAAHAPSAYLHLCGESLALRGAWVDVDEFERLAATAAASGRRTDFEQALATYSGDLLPDDRYEPWVEERALALQERYLRLLRILAAVLEREGAFLAAAERLSTVLQRDPADEEAHRDLMRLYTAMGHRSLALRQHEACVRALRRELDAAPGIETERLYRQLCDKGSVAEQGTLSLPLGPFSAEGSLPRLTQELRRAEEETAALLERTADASRWAHSNELAEHYFRELVRRYEQLAANREAARAREKWAAVLGVMGRYDEALAVLDRAVELYRALDDPEGVEQSLARMGRLHYRRGSAQEGLALLEPAHAPLLHCAPLSSGRQT